MPLWYSLLWMQPKITGNAGAVFASISRNQICALSLPLPPLDEQKRIVAVLDEAFEGLDRARANAEANLADARDLFDEICQSAIAVDIERYGIIELSALALEITDGDHMPPPKSTSGVPFITISNIRRDTRRIDFSETFMVPHAYFDLLRESKKPIDGDILYTVTGATLGIPVLIDSYPNFCFQRHIGLIRPKSHINSVWLYYVLMSKFVFQQATARATGAAQKTVSLKVLRSISIPNSPADRQVYLSEVWDAAWKATSMARQRYSDTISDLTSLRQSLLQKAFSGALT
ncbi:restriction endonuclease subunit S [Rhodobacter capsulatus]|uniref:restriction endonuclease subunit S n=1 Tax=Rhodobacter capsulatus TaxID=1061 RepID=UPI0040265F90